MTSENYSKALLWTSLVSCYHPLNRNSLINHPFRNLKFFMLTTLFRVGLRSARFYSSMTPPAKKTALVLLAPGSEEMEFTISVDVLRRAGINVTVAGVNGTMPARCSRDVCIAPDDGLTDAVTRGPYDAVVLPGGLGGSKTFCALEEVGTVLKDQEKDGRLIAAICAAPLALKAHGIGLGKKITAYPSVKDELATDYQYCTDKVVIDGKLLTSQGPGTAFDFALSIAEQLVGKDIAADVRKELLL